jgi:transposase InsO family protein
MSRKGNCWDNAPAESFFGTLKTELINRKSWPSPAAAKDAIGEYIHSFYNHKRLHSANGYQSPVDYEHNQQKEKAYMAA